VNVGSVWKNTTEERVRFPICKEKFVDLTATGSTFQTLVQQYINPGNRQLFPIFAEIAKNYEQSECNHLRVVFRTEEYMASGSVVSAGLAALATNFDPDAANFASFTEAENYSHSISGAPFSGLIVHDILAEHRKKFGGAGRHRNNPNDLSTNNYFVNYSENQIAPNSQTKFYDMGNFQFLVNQAVQAGLIGELWIEYSFTLIRRLQRPGAPAGGIAHWSSVTAATANNFTGAVLQSGNTLTGITLGVNTISFPAGFPGNYKVDLTVAGGTSASATGISSYGTGSGLNLFTGSGVRNAVSSVDSLGGTTTSVASSSSTITVPVGGCTLTVTPSTIVGTGSLDLFITSLPTSVLTLAEKEQEEIDEVKNELEELRDQVAEMRKMMMNFNSRDGSASSGLLRDDVLSEPSTPDENKGADLERSVHISKSMAERLLSAVSRK